MRLRVSLIARPIQRQETSRKGALPRPSSFRHLQRFNFIRSISLKSFPNEGVSNMTGSPRYYITHAGRLSGKEIKEYLCTVTDAGAEIADISSHRAN